MKRLRRASAIAAIAAVAAVVPLGTGDAVAAGSDQCGFIGNETYVHCDPRTGVQIAVQDALGRIVATPCVGWGPHPLGGYSSWPIINAWYTGNVCWVHE